MTLTPGNPMRVVLLSILLFEVIVFGLAIPVMILVSDVPAADAALAGGGAALLALVAAACCAARPGTSSAGSPSCAGWRSAS